MYLKHVYELNEVKLISVEILHVMKISKYRIQKTSACTFKNVLVHVKDLNLSNVMQKLVKSSHNWPCVLEIM